MVEEGARKDLFGSETEKWFARRRVGDFRVGESASCGNADHRWRTKLEFGSGEPLDDSHRSTALGTAPRRWVVGARNMLFDLRLRCGAEHVKTKWQELGAFAVGQEAEVTDAHKTFRQDMQ